MGIYSLAVLALLSVSTTAQETRDQLRLHADVLSQRYCEVDRRTNALLVKFKIKLANTRNPAVLYYPNPYPILLVARTHADLLKHRYEFQLHAPDVFVLVNDRTEAHPRLVPRVLRAGEELEAETMEITVPAPRAFRLSRHEAVHAGVHYVQLHMDLQVEGRPLTFIRALSQPIPLTIERNTKPQKCQ